MHLKPRPSNPINQSFISANQTILSINSIQTLQTTQTGENIIHIEYEDGTTYEGQFKDDLKNGYGILTLVTLIATVKLSDSFAYFAGKRFGTIKLAPELSPGKTLQGSLGAPVGGCLAAAICLFVVAPMIFDITVQKPWWWFLVYGILVTAAGMMGDLAESLIKRDCNTKDSSSWLPGLGGVLDILDSMVFAAPVSYFLWIVA